MLNMIESFLMLNMIEPFLNQKMHVICQSSKSFYGLQFFEFTFQDQLFLSLIVLARFIILFCASFKFECFMEFLGVVKYG